MLLAIFCKIMIGKCYIAFAIGNLWEKRVAIISTLAFVRHNDFTDAMKLSEILMYEKT